MGENVRGTSQFFHTQLLFPTLVNGDTDGACTANGARVARINAHENVFTTLDNWWVWLLLMMHWESQTKSSDAEAQNPLRALRINPHPCLSLFAIEVPRYHGRCLHHAKQRLYFLFICIFIQSANRRPWAGRAKSMTWQDREGIQATAPQQTTNRPTHPHGTKARGTHWAGGHWD